MTTVVEGPLDVTMPPLTVNGASSGTVASAPPPQGDMTNGAGTYDGVPAGVVWSSGKWSNGPTGHATYWDTVVSLAINAANGALTQENPNLPVPRWGLESKFFQGGVFATEFHGSVSHLNGGAGQDYRWLSAFIPFNKSDLKAKSNALLRGGRVIIGDTEDNNYAQIIYDFTTSTPVAWLEKGLRLHQGLNNIPWVRQRNAAGNAMINLPFIDARDRLVHDRPTTTNGSFGASNLGLGSSADESQMAGATVNATCRHFLSSTVVTGHHWGDSMAGRATVSFGNRLCNQTAGGSVFYRLEAVSGNVAYEWADPTSGKGWAATYVQQSGDLVVSKNGAMGQPSANVAYSVLDDTLQVKHERPPVLPTYTQATLPSPSTMGAGSLAYASDIDGGAVVVSTGSAWKRILTGAL